MEIALQNFHPFRHVFHEWLLSFQDMVVLFWLSLHFTLCKQTMWLPDAATSSVRCLMQWMGTPHELLTRVSSISSIIQLCRRSQASTIILIGDYLLSMQWSQICVIPIFNVGTKFGAMLDQLTDRCGTMGLLVTLSYFYPKYMFWFQLSMAIDVACHWIYLHTLVDLCYDLHAFLIHQIYTPVSGQRCRAKLLTSFSIRTRMHSWDSTIERTFWHSCAVVMNCSTPLCTCSISPLDLQVSVYWCCSHYN